MPEIYLSAATIVAMDQPIERAAFLWHEELGHTIDCKKVGQTTFTFFHCRKVKSPMSQYGAGILLIWVLILLSSEHEV